MVRELRAIEEGIGGGAMLMLWVGLVTLSLICATIFFCADGAPKHKATATDHHGAYSPDCTAGCGAACGA
ncbi:hypothetical protein MRB53_024340 [Persea americana]|uniref:Uncharacterized protein n=1 Tax=Persea americana TaxID=3435 RepID=A0ACC2LBX1_PERAE|nr:hypothetical protein MRB53_024340 [Persea americana]